MLKRIILMTIALFGAVSPSRASLDAAKGLSQYVRQSWSGETGLPQSSVQSIAQTADGYLWVERKRVWCALTV